MRILITGATGFVGGHLCDALLAEGGHTVVGVSRSGRPPAGLAHLDGKVESVTAELADAAAVEAVLARVRPDWLFHLAGYANTGKSFREPAQCWADNLDATRALFDAVHRSGVRCRIVFASTGLIYGDPDPTRPDCDEQTPLRPASPYAASKAAADLLAYQVTRSPGLDVVRVRLFNQLGPRQSADYAAANFARQIAAAEAGQQPPVIDTGDLSSHRDLTDVRDMVAAVRLLAEHGATGEAYNAGTGRTWQIREVLERLVSLGRVPVEVRSKVEPGRTGDTAVTRADPRKLAAATGWRPRFDLDRTLRDTLDYWRSLT